MADEEVATRAPESDAQDAPTSAAPTPAAAQSSSTGATTTFLASIPHDTPAQQGPSMGEHCTTDRALPIDSAAPAGELLHLNGVECYVSKPASYPSAPGKLLLFLTGGTGVHSANNQLQADAFAARGFVVVMPDQFGGDAAPKTAATQEDYTAQPGISLLERIKLGAAETAKSFLIDMWLARHTPETVLPILDKVLAGVHEAYADAVAGGGGIYGVGYCFGAKYILLLCGQGSNSLSSGGTGLLGGLGAGKKRAAGSTLSPVSPVSPVSPTAAAAATSSTAPATATATANKDKDEDEEPKGQKEDDATAPPPRQEPPALKAGSIAHGTLITADDIASVRQPISMACVANDSLFPDAVREQGRASLELNAVEHEIRLFPGVPHGFAVVGEYASHVIKTAQADAFEMMAAFLERY